VILAEVTARWLYQHGERRRLHSPLFKRLVLLPAVFIAYLLLVSAACPLDTGMDTVCRSQVGTMRHSRSDTS